MTDAEKARVGEIFVVLDTLYKEHAIKTWALGRVFNGFYVVLRIRRPVPQKVEAFGLTWEQVQTNLTKALEDVMLAK